MVNESEIGRVCNGEYQRVKALAFECGDFRYNIATAPFGTHERIHFFQWLAMCVESGIVTKKLIKLIILAKRRI